MEFRIADTFLDSLARLTGDEQKAVKTTAFDLQVNPANPGMSFHKLDRAKDKNFWSVRVNSDLRLIVHRVTGSLLLCYVGHHDKAYAWAERRRLEVHPKTGAAQIVEIRETVRDVVIPVYTPASVAEQAAATALTTPPRRASERTLLFAKMSDEELLAYGVPAEWLRDVKGADEDTLLALVDHLPAEASEALLELATGGRPRAGLPIAAGSSGPARVDVPQEGLSKRAIEARPIPPEAARGQRPDPFDHPDALRRFRLVANVEELERALEYPWDKWTIFLHPNQRTWVERAYSGPARVSGSAGTGKTIVALHRAVFLARTNPEGRILLATYSEPLAASLRTRLKRLLVGEPRLGERIDVHSLDAIGTRLYATHVAPPKIAATDTLRDLVRAAAAAVGGHAFGLPFLMAEWDHVVDAWRLQSWEEYRDVARLGRRTRLPEPSRAILWSIFEKVRSGLRERGLITRAEMFTTLAEALAKGGKIVFDFAVVDEAQDLSVAHLRFFAALGRDRPNALFFAGDLGQRIFQQPFSWKSLGVEIRGRSYTLRVNYRTSHQIRIQADRLLDPVVTDVDGNAEDRGHTVSVFNGPPPDIRVIKTESDEIEAVGAWIAARGEEGVLPHEIGVFVRLAGQLDRAQAAADRAGIPVKVLDDHVETASGHLSIGTMHLAKGLEFRAVVVMACDDEVVPLQERIENVGDDADLQEVYDTERHLLYVACTRARDHLIVTGVAPASEFFDDLRSAPAPV